jgi:GT2 family glycosyltransferase
MTSVWGVVVHYGDAEPTLRCLESLAASSRVPDGVVVVDNGGGFRPPPGLPVQVVVPGYNAGFAVGIARGADHALARGADLVWILNNDTLIDPECLGRLMATAAAQPEAGFLSPLVLYADSGTAWFAGGEVDRRTMRVRHRTDARETGRPFDTGFVTGCAMLVRREVFARCGPPDARLFMYFEDVDWCLRGRAAGLHSIVVPGARVLHHVARRGGRRVFSPATMYLMTRNRLLLGRRYSSRCAVLPATLAWGLRQVAKGPTPRESIRSLRAVFAGLADGWRGRSGPLPADAGAFVA